MHKEKTGSYFTHLAMGEQKIIDSFAFTEDIFVENFKQMYQRNMNYPYSISSDLDSDEESDQEILFENDLLLMKKMQMEANLSRCENSINTENNSCNGECSL